MTQWIGHITTPIEAEHVERIRKILEGHGVIWYPPYHRPSYDGWYTLILPGNSQFQNGIVTLADGYTFKYQQPIIDRQPDEKYIPDRYERLPQITIPDKKP